MKAVSWLYNNEFLEPCSQVFSDDILLRFNPNRVPGSFIIIDLASSYNRGTCLEIQGDISQQDVSYIAESVELQNPEPIVYQNDTIGWRIVTGLYNMITRTAYENDHYMSLWSRVLNNLRQSGWVYSFTYTKGYAPGSVYFKPNI